MKRRWLLGAGAGLLALAWFGGPLLLRRAEFFRVRRVEFAGMRYGDPAAALRTLRLDSSASVFDDLSPIAVRAESIAGVVDARVSRRLPGTLVVAVVERRPVALVLAGGVLRFMDSLGATLPFAPAGHEVDLPVSRTADSSVALLLARLDRHAPWLFARISEASRDGIDVTLLVDGRRILLRPDATLEEMQAVRLVAQRLAAMNVPYAELDGRYAGTVVVRGMST